MPATDHGDGGDVIDDRLDRVVAAGAVATCSARVGDASEGVGASGNGGTDGAVVDVFAVADDHDCEVTELSKMNTIGGPKNYLQSKLGTPNIFSVIERDGSPHRATGCDGVAESLVPSWPLIDAPVPVAQLRLAAGLTTAVPGAELRARCSTGAELVVSDHPAADVTASTMRSVAVETWRRCRWAEDEATIPHLGDLRLGGSIDDLGGGVLRVVGPDGAEQRWLATVLPPDELVELLASVGRDLADVDDDALHARVVPDRELGVALIEITADAGIPIGLLDRAAADAAARCYVAELVRTL